MKSKISISIILILLILISSSINNLYSQGSEQTTELIYSLAQSGLEKNIGIIPKSNITNFGFNSRNDLNDIELGSPIRTYTFDKAFYADSILEDRNYIYAIDEYRVPLIVDDTIRSFLLVGKMNTEWKIVGIGGSLLAIKIMQCVEKNQIDMVQSIRLLREPLSRSDYLITDFESETNEMILFPVISSLNSFNHELPEKGMTEMEILPLIHRNYVSNKQAY